MAVAIIVQARMGSTRFPGKIMEPFLPLEIGEPPEPILDPHAPPFLAPVLAHVLARCKAARRADFVVLATPDSLDHSKAWELAERMDVYCGIGSEDDVLGRYLQTAVAFGLQAHDHIVRVTADCPLLDPRVVDELIELHIKKRADYSSNVLPRTYPKGLDAEIMTFDALEAAWIKAHKGSRAKSSKAAYEREHVTPWLQETDGIKRANLCQKVNQAEINLCVDYPEDIVRVPALLKALRGRPRGPKLWTPPKKKLIH
jgi:spore coat polysaccharide biosynthesis protein SpsF (cytidylyltransferase family)